MTRMVWLLAAAGAAMAFCACAGEKPLKVFVCAGQSNMVGKRCEVSELPEPLKTPRDGNLFFDGEEWLPLAPGVTEETGFGPEIAFAGRMSRELGEPVGIIKHSRGGTALGGRWAPDRPDGLYAQLRKKVDAARETRAIEIVGMLWMQGERDSRDPEMAANYGKNLTGFIRRARNDFGNPDMFFVAGRVNPPPEEFLYVEAVRGAQANCPAGHYGWVDCDPLEKGPDNLHYSTAGTVELGRLFANAMLELMGR